MKRRHLLKLPILGAGAATLSTLGLNTIKSASAQPAEGDNNSASTWVEIDNWMVSPDAKRARVERELAQTQAQLNQVQRELNTAKETIDELNAESEKTWAEKLKDLF